MNDETLVAAVGDGAVVFLKITIEHRDNASAINFLGMHAWILM